MPRVKFLLNIGRKDAARLDLDADKAREGAVINVSSEIADELLKHGWAVGASGESAAAAAPESAPAPPDFDAMTKEELHAFAQSHGIEGVSMAMHKDEQVRLIKRAMRK